MLTKEECIKALQKIEDGFGCDMAYYDLHIERDTLGQLIDEHFELVEKYQELQDENARLSFDKIVNNIEDMNYKLWLENPPLKFEELKEGMWVWCGGSYSQITELSNFGKIKLVYFDCDSVRFKEGCFYRKQVE